MVFDLDEGQYKGYVDDHGENKAYRHVMLTDEEWEHAIAFGVGTSARFDDELERLVRAKLALVDSIEGDLSYNADDVTGDVRAVRRPKVDGQPYRQVCIRLLKKMSFTTHDLIKQVQLVRWEGSRT
jgi:hypothetical protein